MTAAMSKRTQLRNEKALQDLIKTVPGNERCADCEARNPGTFDPSLGIFLCMRCASLHRKLGTHISKVKSLSMDSWNNDQVETMRRHGNVTSNKIYNPRNSKPTIPLDVDEVDTALERFIRQKYDQQNFSRSGAILPAARHDTGSTRSSDDQPPPLPPKPGKRFGFAMRSVSSALPMTKHSHISPPTSPDTANGYPPSPPIRVNKQSRVFGASVGGTENMESKLVTLQDMGFADEKRNSAILKGLNGNLERAIETLVRLGDGNTPTSRPRSPAKARQVAVSQPIAMSQPFSCVGVEPPHATVNGISTTRHEMKPEPATLPTKAPERTKSGEQPRQPYPYNPFDVPNARSDTWPLEKAMENMQVSQSQQQPQPLFPNATGGYPIQPQHVEASRLQQSMTPPVPQLHQHLHSNPYAQQMPRPNNTYNPFFQQVPQIPADFYTPNDQNQSSNNDAYNLNNAIHAPPHALNHFNSLQSPQEFWPQQMPQHQQLHMTNQSQAMPLYQQQQQQQQQRNPFLSLQPAIAQSQYQPTAQPNQYQPQPQQAQPTGRFDKSSILALYNYPQLAPSHLPNGNVSSENEAPSTNSFVSQSLGSNPRMPGQRSVTMPVQLGSGSRNPFHTANHNSAAVSSNAVPAIPSGLSRHVSQESVDVSGSHNGRHSPDAFAGLSARFVL
ncbi:MAG: hypothetical protein Q9224_005038 [Gallowayella concinna]